MVSELTSDIDPGPGGSSGKAGHAGSWPASILVPGAGTSRVYTAIRRWLPREMDFPADLFLRVDMSLLCYTGMDGRWIYVHSDGRVYEVFLQRWGGNICTLILV